MENSKSKAALELWDKLSRAYDKVHKAQVKQMSEEKLTAPQFNVLEVLVKAGSMPLKRISEELLVTGANITCVVDNLEKEGLVQRIHSKEDRRIILAELTDKGKEKIAKILPKYGDNMAGVASVLSEQEQNELTKLLSKLYV